MIIFDSTFLIVYLHPNPETPRDRNNQPVTEFRERVNHLVATLSASEQIIGVPTPALAEVLVRAGAGKFKYLQILSDAYRFEILPFGQRAAIDAGELIEKVKSESKGQPIETWAKVKFDIQIVAIGKTEEATVIYSDDKGIEAHGKRLNIPVKRICDLELPPRPPTRRVRFEPSSGLFDQPPQEPSLEETEIANKNEVTEDETNKQTGQAERATNDTPAETAPSDTAPIRGIDEGCIASQTPGETPFQAAQAEGEEKPKATSEGGLGGDGS